MKSIKYVIIYISLIFPVFLDGQSYDLSSYSRAISATELKSIVSFLADDLCRGRESGSRGNQIAGSYIRNYFDSLGLKPYKGSYYQSFRNDSIIGRNIVGIVESRYKSEDYIIISAHYDHLGAFEGNIYNGADDNASGVAAMMTLAKLFSNMSKSGEAPQKNIIFVAFDGKENNMAGSEYFIKTMGIAASKVKFVLNIDQIGSIFSPSGKSPNYILILGAHGKNMKLRDRIDFLNIYSRAYLDLDFTYYKSSAFYSIFYRSSDHINFADKGISSLLFTSGITAHTYKPSDDYDLLDYEVLANRIKLIYFTAFDLMN